jgi:peroxiredoxin
MLSPLQAQQPTANAFTVHVFLLEDCVISQNCTAALRQLHGEFSGGNIRFVGLFPNDFSKKRSIRRFGRKYCLPFPLRKDRRQALARRFGATVTPEAALVNDATGEVLYRGRIDDSYAALGQRRPAPTSHDLREALQALAEGRQPSVQRTVAVGCFIEFE